MNYAQKIIEKFGGATQLAALLGHRSPSTVYAWGSAGRIPQKHHQEIYDLAQRQGVDLVPADFVAVVPGSPA